MTFLLANWRLVGIGLLLLGVGSYIAHCQHVKSNWEKAKAIAEEQNKQNAKQALRDIKNKERSDENYKRDIARLDADLKRLRNARTSFVPSTGSNPGSAETACFDRADLDSAIRGYRAGILGLLEQGAKAIEGLEEAKQWARDR